MELTLPRFELHFASFSSTKLYLFSKWKCASSWLQVFENSPETSYFKDSVMTCRIKYIFFWWEIFCPVSGMTLLHGLEDMHKHFFFNSSTKPDSDTDTGTWLSLYLCQLYSDGNIVSAVLGWEYWWNNPKRNPRWITYSSYEIFIPIGSSPRSGSSLNRFWSSIFSFVNFYQFSISSSSRMRWDVTVSGRAKTYLGFFS